MNKFKLYIRTFWHLFFCIITITNIHAKNLEKFYEGDQVSDYFSGILSLNDNEYGNSYAFLKNLSGLEDNHYPYAQAYLYSLININKFNEAVKYAENLEKKNIDHFESNLIIGTYYLKNNQYEKARDYFIKINNQPVKSPLQKLLSKSLLNWVNFPELNLELAKNKLNLMDARFKNITQIQKSFANCYYDSPETVKSFENLTSNINTDFSRYNFFLSNYLISKNKKKDAQEIIEKTLDKLPRNLILKQLKFDMESKEESNFKNNFNCKNISHVIAEFFYITANALSGESIYSISNFYLNLAKYLNPNFISFDVLQAENFYMIDNLKKAESIYKNIQRKGKAYSWYSSKQIAMILNKRKKNDESLYFLTDEYNKILDPDIYEIFDYASFLKNNKKYEESINYYSKVLNLIDSSHDLYPKITDGRGIAFEQIGKWDNAEQDFLNSLSVSPKQAYVINYLAYSWIEQGIKIEESLKMLEEANTLRKNDGFITDSLGWALFKLERYKNAEKYLQQAVNLMPSDPVINDHYGDSLWMSGKKIEARYFWSYVLNLENIEDDLKKKINEKLIYGLNVKM